jgi:hypothetical protein
MTTFPWNTPFSFNPTAGFGMASSLAPGAAAAAAPAAAGAAGGAGGALSMLGGPVGMAAATGIGFVGDLLAGNAAGHAMKGAMNAQRIQAQNMLAARQYENEQDLARELRAETLKKDMRLAGVNRPEYFSSFMKSGMPAAAAAKMSFSPIMRF